MSRRKRCFLASCCLLDGHPGWHKPYPFAPPCDHRTSWYGINNLYKGVDATVKVCGRCHAPLPFGPANDEPPAVQDEILAAWAVSVMAEPGGRFALEDVVMCAVEEEAGGTATDWDAFWTGYTDEDGQAPVADEDLSCYQAGGLARFAFDGRR